MFGFCLNFFWYAVSAENKHAACWDLLKRFHKNHALAAPLIAHHRVIDNLMPYIDRRAETRARQFQSRDPRRRKSRAAARAEPQGRWRKILAWQSRIWRTAMMCTSKIS